MNYLITVAPSNLYIDVNDRTDIKQIPAKQPERIRDYEEDGLYLFSHQAESSIYWAVSEVETGMKMAEAPTKAEVLAELKQVINRVGLDEIKQYREQLSAHVQNLLQQQGG